MGLDDKSEKNYRLAEKFEKQSEFDFCTNRLYYSFYQKVLSVQSKKRIKVDKSTSGSHVNTFVAVIQKVRFDGKDLTDIDVMKEFMLHKNVFINLKKFREKADYENDNVSREEFVSVKSLYLHACSFFEES